MKHIILYLLLSTFLLASLENINSFEADFIQNVVDDKGKILTYKGHIRASKPQYALWNYIQPVTKDIYINSHSVTLIEPEIEQAIIRKIELNFNFFKMVKKAKKIGKNSYIASFQNSDFKIVINENLIQSISYRDEFDNSVEILFEKQKQNIKMDETIFTPYIPLNFDIIRD